MGGWSWASYGWGVLSGAALVVALLAALAVPGARRKSPVVGRRDGPRDRWDGTDGPGPTNPLKPTRKTQWD